MRHAKLIVGYVVLLASLAAAARAQEPLPTGPFRAVHLVTLATAADEASLLAAIADNNAAVAAAGYPEVRYRLYKVTGKQTGTHNYLWESSWPGGAVYDKVHKSPGFQAVAKKHPGIAALMKDEIYNRYVEVASPKP